MAQGSCYLLSPPTGWWTAPADAYKAFMRHLRNALVRIGLDPADADHYTGHSMRSGAATATADELPLHLTSRAARVIDINWILTDYRASIGDRMSVPWALGLRGPGKGEESRARGGGAAPGAFSVVGSLGG